MPPKTRTPRAKPAETPSPVGAGLAAAPDSGIPYGASGAAATRKPAGRRGVPLGLRIPQETFDRLGATSERTGITRQRILTDALEAYLATLE
jgi:hypothetical protein